MWVWYQTDVVLDHLKLIEIFMPHTIRHKSLPNLCEQEFHHTSQGLQMYSAIYVEESKTLLRGTQ